MKRLLSIVMTASALAACATGPFSPPAPPPPPSITYALPPSGAVFRPQDFTWSKRPGDSSIHGALAFHVGALRYACAGGDVILTPETPWSRRRMSILYGSPVIAEVPVALARARTPSAPSGDYASFVRKTTCDRANHFAFPDLPEGGWFVITVAKPVGAPGEPVAVMRRVETNGGPRVVTLN